MHTPGFTVREIQSIDGARSFCEEFFNDVIVNEADMLGAPDEGWAAAPRVLSIERATNRMYRARRFQSEMDHLVADCRSDPRTFALLREHTRELAQTRAEIEMLKGHVETLVLAKALSGIDPVLAGALCAGETVATIAWADLLRTAFVHGSVVHGSVTRCLQIAAGYAQERSQFGKLLLANQALRHRISGDAVVIETVSNGLARALREPAEGAVLAREALWRWATGAGPSVAESAIQVFGGMGFTWDVPLHRHPRRMRTLACQGQAVETLDRIGDGVIAGSTNAWHEDIADVV